MGNEERVARRLVKAMNEIVAPPMHDEDEEDEGAPMGNGIDHGGHEDEEEPHDDEDMDMDDMGGDEDHEDGEEDHEDMGDEMGGGDDEGLGEPPHSKIMPPKKKKPNPHGNMLDAMKDSPMMAHFMKMMSGQ